MGLIWSLALSFLLEYSMNLSVKWFVVLLQNFYLINSVKEKKRNCNCVYYIVIALV